MRRAGCIIAESRDIDNHIYKQIMSKVAVLIFIPALPMCAVAHIQLFAAAAPVEAT
jgi:hypothetical protein